jgi:hypothetical protein
VIMFPRVGDTWEIAEASSPLILLATLEYIEQTLGIAPYWSAGDVGQRLMRAINGGTPQKWTAPADLSPFPAILAATRAPRPFSWHRPPSPEEVARPYLIGIDKNSAWPAACTHVRLGIGLPHHVSSQEIELAIPACGCYRLTNLVPPPILPCPLPGITELVPGEWIWAPTLGALHKLGFTVQIAEAYLWQEARTILRPWAEHLWHARQSVRSDATTYPQEEARALAQHALKKIANVGLQWLDLQGNEFSFGQAYHRPDWYALIRDRARAAQLEQIAYFASKYKLAPLMIHVDALYYAVESPDIEQSLPGLLARSHALGGYKNAFTASSLPFAPFVALFATTTKTTLIHHVLHAYDAQRSGGYPHDSPSPPAR